MARKQYKIEFEIGATVTPQMKKAFDTAQKQVERLSKVKSVSNEVALGIGKIATVGAIAQKALSFGSDSIQSAIQYESKMADVKKVVDELGDAENLAKFKDDVKNLTQVLPMSNEEILDIATSAGQAGIAFDELTRFTEDAGKMSIAFDTSAEQAGEWMSQWRNAFKMSQDEVNKLSDTINYLSNTSGATASQISSIVTKIGPLGDVAGVGASQLAALGTSMVTVGVDEDVAATGIKNLMLNLSKGAAATGTQVEAFKKLKLNAKQLAKDMQQDAQGTILNVFESIQKLNASDQTSVLQQIFGTESVAAIAPLLSNLDLLKEQFNKVGDASLYAGSMQQEFETRSSTTENKIQLAENAIENLKLTIGESFLPVIGQVAQAFTDLMNSEQIGNITNQITENLGTMIPIIMEIIDNVKPILNEIINIIVNIAKAIAPVIKSITSAVMPVIQKLIPPIQTIAGMIMNIIQAVLPPLSTLINSLIPVISFLAQAVQTGINLILRSCTTSHKLYCTSDTRNNK